MASRLPIIQPADLVTPTVPSDLRGDGKSVFVVSLGCPKNRTDTEAMLARMGQAGYGLAGDADSADVLLVNTCTFIDASTEESIDTVLELGELKKAAGDKKLVVTGCMAQRHHDELRNPVPAEEANACLLAFASPTNRYLGHICTA